MDNITWYRLSERAPTEADADERGHVLWCRENNTPVAVGLNAGWTESDTVYWRRLTPSDYPPKPREPRKATVWMFWPTNVEGAWQCVHRESEACGLVNNLGGHIQRVEITEDLGRSDERLPEGER